MTSPVNVNEEYKKILRTKSFLDMCSKVHQQLRRTISSSEDDDGDKDEASHHPTVSCTKISEFLLELSQESVVEATTATINGCSAYLYLHSLLLEYFDVTFRACTACTNVVASINRAREYHRSIRHLLIKLSSTCLFDGGCTEFDRLASRLQLDNPLHPQNLANFHSVQSRCSLLMQQLARAQRGIHRRLRYVRLPKKATALVVAVAIAVRTAIGFGVVAAAAPVVMTTGPRAGMRWARTERARDLGRLGAQVDAAAKGAYIVGRDLETVSRMVRRVQDEVEHEREVARLALRYRDPQLVREAARVVEGGGYGSADGGVGGACLLVLDHHQQEQEDGGRMGGGEEDGGGGGSDDPHIPSTHEGLLKWKYPSKNPVDFLFEALPEEDEQPFEEHFEGGIIHDEIVEFAVATMRQ
ncbi:mRNA capping enzyme, C-terminal domain, partial [Musa troglodytarum]